MCEHVSLGMISVSSVLPQVLHSRCLRPSIVRVTSTSTIHFAGQNTGRDNTAIDLSYLETGTYDVKVCARGNGADVLPSNYTQALQIYRLMSPYDIKIKTDRESEGALSFSSDPNQSGSGFELFIDGSETAIPVDNLTNVKQYITTTGTEIFMRASANRYNELTIEQETKQLSTPDFKIGYSEDSYKSNGKILVDITLETPLANGYAYIVGGVVITSDKTSFEYNPNGAGSYAVGVYAIGGLFDENNVYYLSSQTCGNNDSYTIKLLGSVDESSVNLSIDGRITWGTVDAAVKYTIKLTINGVEKEPITTNNPAYDLSDIIAFKNVGSLEIEIQAHGNNKCVSSSITKKSWPVVIH